jgi:UDP-N-acetylmuramoylalanine--D-glutamate ligase
MNAEKVLVVGLGDTGLSMARWLKGRGATVAVADSRVRPPHADRLREEMPDVPLFAGEFREDVFLNADLLAVSPGVSLREPALARARARGVPVAGDIELFAAALATRNPRPPVLAITGSNGKSTVTAMTGAMCQKAGMKTTVAGNIGLPVLDALWEEERSGQVPDVYVLELSSFQLETTSRLEPTAATVLNVTEDHMDRYADLAEYAAAKARIFAGSGVQVLNREDACSRRMAIPGRRVVTFGLDPAPSREDWGLITVEGKPWLAQGETPLMAVSDLPLAGFHNVANALAALALTRAIGLRVEPLLQALREFRGLPHRVERVAEIRGVTFYDDSKGTNVGATVAALKGMTQKVVLIAGGDGKGQDFAPLRDAVAGRARAVVLIGRDGEKIGKALEGSGVPLLRAKTLEDAVEAGLAQARTGDAVLLSPACASFDMFRNYEHRAEVFVGAVRRLAKEKSA